MYLNIKLEIPSRDNTFVDYCEVNIHTWVKGRTPSRDKFTVWTSEVSPSQVYEDMINITLFYSHFSSRKLVYN